MARSGKILKSQISVIRAKTNTKCNLGRPLLNEVFAQEQDESGSITKLGITWHGESWRGW